MEKLYPRKYELEPRYSSRKSFYGKATEIYHDDGSIELKSYSTIVARITPTGKAVVYGQYSQTTTRHIKEFLKQHGFYADNMKQILKDYGEV